MCLEVSYSVLELLLSLHLQFYQKLQILDYFLITFDLLPLLILVEFLPSDLFLKVELDHLGLLLDFVLMGEVGDGGETETI